MSQLPADCLNEIFEYLEDDKVTLHSCLFVNCIWCEVAVRILWRSGLKYDAKNLVEDKERVLRALFTTLITCLPNESKGILHNNGIVISTSISKPPMFNYASFCKSLSNYKVYCGIFCFLKHQQSISKQDRDNKICIVEQEIYKLFM